MGDVTIHFRGMHLFVFHDDPATPTEGVTVYAPSASPHVHTWTVMLDTRTRATGAHWQGDFALAVEDTADWLCVQPAEPAVLSMAGAPLLSAVIAGTTEVADLGVALADVAGSGTVNQAIDAVHTYITLTGGTLHVEAPASPALRKLWDVGGRRQCLADHVVWRLTGTTDAATLTIGARTFPFDASARINCVNYPDHVMDASGTLTHIKALHQYVDATKDDDAVITTERCERWDPVGGGGFPIECPYAWARR